MSFSTPSRRPTLIVEPDARELITNLSRTDTDAEDVRPHGRDAEWPVDEAEADPATPEGLAERARLVHRFDRRSPSLRLVASELNTHDAASEIVSAVAAAVGSERFARAFDAQVSLTVQDRVVEVRTGGRTSAGLIERRFGPAIMQAARQTLGPDAEIRYVVVQAAEAPAPVKPATASTAGRTPLRAVATSRTGTSETRGRNYRLEDFVVGESNRLAYSAVLQMADAELGEQRAGGGAPLFIYGPCGVGKTHLLQGLGQRFRERHPGATIRVVSGETFLNEFVSAVRHGGGSSMTGQSRSVAGSGGIERFRRQYRRCDLLCIDDVHFLASKQATQQELLHTFDQIAQSGARIVLACDQHPRQMKSGDGGFSPALVSRFLSGMVAGIEPPDATVRERAARTFAQRRGLVLEEAALRRLVERTQTVPGQSPISVRDLEGLLTRIEAVHRLGAGQGGSGTAVGLLAVEQAMNMAGDGRGGAPMTLVRRPIRAEQILAQTCLALGVERADLSASTRHKRVVLARAVITHLCRELTTMSFPEIARAIGRPSHSTVITAHQRLMKQIEADEVYGIGVGGEAMTVGSLVRQLAAALMRG